MKRILICLLLVAGCDVGDKAMRLRKVNRKSQMHEEIVSRLISDWQKQERQRELDDFMEWYDKKYGGKKNGN